MNITLSFTLRHIVIYSIIIAIVIFLLYKYFSPIDKKVQFNMSVTKVYNVPANNARKNQHFKRDYTKNIREAQRLGSARKLAQRSLEKL